MYFSCFFNWFYDLRKQSSQIPRYYVKILLNLHLNAIKTPKLSRSNIVMSHYKHLNEKLKKNELKTSRSHLSFISAERVNIIAETRMFFVILLSGYSFYIIPLDTEWLGVGEEVRWVPMGMFLLFFIFAKFLQAVAAM